MKSILKALFAVTAFLVAVTTAIETPVVGQSSSACQDAPLDVLCGEIEMCLDDGATLTTGPQDCENWGTVYHYQDEPGDICTGGCPDDGPDELGECLEDCWGDPGCVKKCYDPDPNGGP